MNCGLADFNVYVNEMLNRQKSSTPMTPAQINQRQEQYSREKLASLAAILGHLARQQSTELRSCFAVLVQVSKLKGTINGAFCLSPFFALI